MTRRYFYDILSLSGLIESFNKNKKKPNSITTFFSFIKTSFLHPLFHRSICLKYFFCNYTENILYESYCSVTLSRTWIYRTGLNILPYD